VYEKLRSKYPDVRVVARDALSSVRGEPDVMYAYREGRVLAAHA